MKYLKYFETETGYVSYKNGSDYVTPNVSYVVDATKTFYNPYTESISSYKIVDLGLTSGLKWADRNVGADSPEDGGLYFAWGETIGYTAEQVGTDKVFNWDNYFDSIAGSPSNFTKYATDKLTTLEAADDAATVHMGGSWRMPTLTEIEELINGTTLTCIDIDGNEVSSTSEGNLKGVRLTSKTNGNSIFIPAVGVCNNSSLSGMDSYGYLWPSNLDNLDSGSSYFLFFGYNGYLNTGLINRFYGFSVRGVCN